MATRAHVSQVVTVITLLGVGGSFKNIHVGTCEVRSVLQLYTLERFELIGKVMRDR